MTAATVATEKSTFRHRDHPFPRSPLNFDSLTRIDLTALSNSELRSLSRTSSAAFDVHSADNVAVVPKLDRSLFNESSGSRRQTYTRPRPLPRIPNSAAAPGHHRRRFPGLLPAPKPPPIAPDDPERSENRAIVDSLKRLIGAADGSASTQNPSPDAMALVVWGNAEMGKCGAADGREMGIFVDSGQRKRKRGKKGGVEGDVVLEIVNKNGVAVDLEALANADDPYGEELRRRTLGMESEAELLLFLRDLGGQWGSRRKRRKIVDACEFGDALPIGWKLIIGLKRRVGRVTLYCRRYLSPSGLQFASCREASSYLQSYFGVNESNLLMDHCGANVLQGRTFSSGSREDGDPIQDIISYPSLPVASNSNECKEEIALLGIENLAEVQVRDLFECHKCNMVFDEKDMYLQHLLSSHQKTTRRYRLRTSVGDGVILKDGKYECQFCHKVFNERRRYNGHVGVHVRNFVKSSEELPDHETAQKSADSPSRDELPPMFSKMDALIEIAQSSFFEASSVEVADATKKFKVASDPDSAAANSHDAGKLACCISEPEMEDDKIDKMPLDPEFDEQDSDEHDREHVMMDGEMEKIDGTGDVHIKENPSLDTATILATTGRSCSDSGTCENVEDGPTVHVDISDQSGVEQPRVCESNVLAPSGDEDSYIEGNKNTACGGTSVVNEVEKYEGSFGDSSNELNNDVMQTIQHNSEGHVNCGVTESPLSPAHCFPSTTHMQYKGDELCVDDEKLGNATGFDELRLDELEPLKFSFLENDGGMETDFDASVHFQSNEVMLNMGGRQQFTAVCVWCSMEFSHQSIDSGVQSDSVGFMCPSCKAKISGQLNVLETSFPMNPHHL